MKNEYDLVHLVVGQLETNCYLLYRKDNRHTLVIDPGGEGRRIREAIQAHKLLPQAVLLTHGHGDHFAGLQELQYPDPIPVALSGDDLPILHGEANRLLAESLDLQIPDHIDRVISNSDFRFPDFPDGQIIFTPGHTPGSLCLHIEDRLFSGDTLFCGSIGRTDLPGGSYESIMHSIDSLRKLPPGTRIFPGHGDFTRMQTEIDLNPFFS